MRIGGLIGLGLLGACLLVFAGLLAPSGAEARHIGTIKGQTIAPPAVAKKAVRVPVVLNRKSQKRMRMRSPLVTLAMWKRKTVRVPRPNGKGKVAVEAKDIRAGDRFRAKVKTRRKHKGKKGGKKAGSSQRLASAALEPSARRKAGRRPATLRARWLTVVSRESRFSVDELTDFSFLLWQTLAALSARVDALAAQMSAGFASLQGQIDALGDDLAKLKKDLAALKAAVEDLQTALDELQDELDALGVTVDGILLDLGHLESDVAGLDSTVSDLCAAVNTLVPDTC